VVGRLGEEVPSECLPGARWSVGSQSILYGDQMEADKGKRACYFDNKSMEVAYGELARS
jgi:hypothetical protein